MTEVNNHKIAVTGNDIRQALINFRKKPGPRTAGAEMERFLLCRDGTLPDARRHDSLYLALRQRLRDNVSVEPGAHMIEIKTGIHENPRSLVREWRRALAALRTESKSCGLVLIDTSDMPGFAPRRLAANLISATDPETRRRRRVVELMKAYERHGWTAIADWGCATTSIQFTHSVADIDTLHRWLKIHAALYPLYCAVFENRTRAADGVHTGIRLRRQMNERGLIADYVFAARDGADLAARYVDFILRNRLLTVLDENGEDEILPQPAAFIDLPPAIQTLGNLLQSASFCWNACKIKMIVDETALQAGRIELFRLLLEVRDMDVSEAAIPAIAGWFCALTESAATMTAVENRLEELGIPVRGDPARAALLTRNALAAVEKGPPGLDNIFGDPARGRTLRDAVHNIVLPLLKANRTALRLWQAAITAHTPPFRTGPAP